MKVFEWFGTAVIALCALAFALIAAEILFFDDLDLAILDDATMLGLPFVALAGALIAAIARADRLSDRPPTHSNPASAATPALQPEHQPSTLARSIGAVGLSFVLFGLAILFLFFVGDVLAGDFDLVLYNFGLGGVPADYNSGTESSGTVVGFFVFLLFALPGGLVAAVGQMIGYRS